MSVVDNLRVSKDKYSRVEKSVIAISRAFGDPIIVDDTHIRWGHFQFSVGALDHIANQFFLNDLINALKNGNTDKIKCVCQKICEGYEYNGRYVARLRIVPKFVNDTIYFDEGRAARAAKGRYKALLDAGITSKPALDSARLAEIQAMKRKDQ